MVAAVRHISLKNPGPPGTGHRKEREHIHQYLRDTNVEYLLNRRYRKEGRRHRRRRLRRINEDLYLQNRRSRDHVTELHQAHHRVVDIEGVRNRIRRRDIVMLVVIPPCHLFVNINISINIRFV